MPLASAAAVLAVPPLPLLLPPRLWVRLVAGTGAALAAVGAESAAPPGVPAAVRAVVPEAACLPLPRGGDGWRPPPEPAAPLPEPEPEPLPESAPAPGAVAPPLPVLLLAAPGGAAAKAPKASTAPRSAPAAGVPRPSAPAVELLGLLLLEAAAGALLAKLELFALSPPRGALLLLPEAAPSCRNPQVGP